MAWVRIQLSNWDWYEIPRMYVVDLPLYKNNKNFVRQAHDRHVFI